MFASNFPIRPSRALDKSRSQADRKHRSQDRIATSDRNSDRTRVSTSQSDRTPLQSWANAADRRSQIAENRDR
eukprot:1020365-Lingulodinium_polyedra.AAC.2